jgi:hypothetical protein
MNFVDELVTQATAADVQILVSRIVSGFETSLQMPHFKGFASGKKHATSSGMECKF